MERDRTPKDAVALIVRRRRQMIVHSIIYYALDESIISDAQWQQWADELLRLQLQWGHKHGFYDREFFDWDGSTGMHLTRLDWGHAKAQALIAQHGKLSNGKSSRSSHTPR